MDELTAPLAVLIDADKKTPKLLSLRNSWTKSRSSATRRCAASTATGPTPKLDGWKEVLLEHSIQPIQQFAYTSGKNATD